MKLKTKAEGICQTCKHDSYCVLKKNRTEAIWHCAEFEGLPENDIRELAKEYVQQQGSMMTVLEEIQGKYGYLPENIIRIVADETGHSLVDVYAVATFYRAFRLKPRGKHLITACIGTACHVRSSIEIVEEIQNQLNIEPGNTTPDNNFTFETVHCLGACGIGPNVVIDGKYYSKVKKEDVAKIIAKTLEEPEKAEISKDVMVFPIEAACSHCNHSLIEADHLIDNYPCIRVTASFGAKHGWLRLSSLYGSYQVESEHNFPKENIINFFCPHCHSELLGASKCPECKAPMVPMIIKGGGILQICSRKGCKGHMLDINGVNL